MILKVFLITMVQRILLFTVTYWVYRSLGFHGYSIITLTILQSVISVSVDMLPLPGGMGISESLYLVMFAPVFGEALLPAMLLSRGISYYAQMLISAVMTCVAYFIYQSCFFNSGYVLCNRWETYDSNFLSGILRTV